MTVRKSPTNTQSKAKFSKHRNSKVAVNPKAAYRCARCNVVLFGQNDLIEHHDIASMSSSSLTSASNPAAFLAGAGVLMGQKSALSKCACLFLKVTDWMQRAGVK